jgi:hypothetical protein
VFANLWQEAMASPWQTRAMTVDFAVRTTQRRTSSPVPGTSLQRSSTRQEKTMAITAIFSVDNISAATGNARTASLSAVTADDGDNTSWSADQFPSGELDLTIDQPKVLDFFQAGKKYRITIQAL